MSDFFVRYFSVEFFLHFFCPIYLNADFFVRYFCLINLSDFFLDVLSDLFERPIFFVACFLSDYFVLFFLSAFSSDCFCPLNVRFFCPIFYPIYVNVRFLVRLFVRIFSPIFCPNYLNVRFFRPIFLSDFLSDSMLRITQLQCPASLSLKSMAKLN